ncbi:hypothetical protein J4234_03790 [Candidatus Woesearchaeota archaeon]|nr:hypothetical protein [Candidatus Woesearchaeota archaeon]
MFLLANDLARFFSTGIKVNGNSPAGNIDSLCDEGLLVIDKVNSRYERIQVYRGQVIGNLFRVTSGWYENGSYGPKGKITIDRMCAIGPGYPIQQFEVKRSDEVFRVEGFEPRRAFEGKPFQENADYL